MGATLILVNGQSAAGKTALAGWLSERLGLPVISKDFFKEQMYDERLPRDRAESQEYGRRAYDLAFGAVEEILREGRSVILEAPMQREHSQAEVEGLIDSTGAGAVQVLLVANREVLRARYIERQRSGERHAGHEVGFTAEWLAGAFVDSFPALEIERTIEIETTDFASVDREAILSRLRGWLGAGSGGAV